MANVNVQVKPAVIESESQLKARLMMENEQLKKQIAAQQAALAAKNTLSIKIGDKGGISVYGLGRFPATFYREQWERLIGPCDSDTDLGIVPVLKEFIRNNLSVLKTKAQSMAEKS